MKIRWNFPNWKAKKLWSFPLLGNPSSFEQTLAGIGLDILEAIRYPDHHDYGMLEMQYISERAASKEAVALITTGKDAVKIRSDRIYLLQQGFAAVHIKHGYYDYRRAGTCLKKQLSMPLKRRRRSNEGFMCNSGPLCFYQAAGQAAGADCR